VAFELSDEQWELIDEDILQNRKLKAIKAIKEAAGVGLREAGDIFHDRYDLLLASRSGEFVCSPDEYYS
jgi:ribosomal protein L7/L12